MARIRVENNRRFRYFPLTTKTGNKCLLGCEKPPAYADGRSRDDYNDCLFLCFPITVIMDIISMPFRGSLHIIRKCTH